ncbi:RWD domain-containing protein 1 [Nilaparvata lugens]|uniref:RWD domain-containing protein 1 n=1 Tax=Nilaparvata lugens TaxID=108931 RepID=UPI00193D531B|nr:RWD domain-containing protein 1 [Nilaparvata lugens]
MDHKEEQNNEIEALDSIYCGEMEIITTEPLYVFIIPVKSDNYDDDQEAGLLARLKFEYTPTYPEEIPTISLDGSENLEELQEQELLDHLEQQAQENIGMVMIFTLVSAAQEWLNTVNDELCRQQVEREELRVKQEEEAERKRFEGTVVTVESFLAWKKAFDLEMGHCRDKDKDEKNKKLTGKELFLCDKSLNQSDLKFLEEGGDSVKVDESLFDEDLDELDLGEENED